MANRKGRDKKIEWIIYIIKLLESITIIGAFVTETIQVIFMKEPTIPENSAKGKTKEVLDYLNVAFGGIGILLAIIVRLLEFAGKLKMYKRFFHITYGDGYQLYLGIISSLFMIFLNLSQRFTDGKVEMGLSVATLLVIAAGVFIAGVYATHMRPGKDTPRGIEENDGNGTNNIDETVGDGMHGSGGSARDDLELDDRDENMA